MSLCPSLSGCVYNKFNVFHKYDCPQVFLSNGMLDPKYVKDPFTTGLHPINLRYEIDTIATSPKEVVFDQISVRMLRSLGNFKGHLQGMSTSR